MRRYIIIMTLCLLGGLTASAQQRLVVQGIGELVGDDYAPRYAVFTEEYCQSEEWLALDEQISAFISANGYDEEPDEDDPLFDWDSMFAGMEEAIANFEREGNAEGAKSVRESLEEAKKYRAEVDDPEARAAALAAAEAVEQARRALLDEVLKHAVGGRLFYYAEAQDDGCHVLVQETFWDGEDEPVSRIMDADGRFADHPSTGLGTVGE